MQEKYYTDISFNQCKKFDQRYATVSILVSIPKNVKMQRIYYTV